MKTKLLALLIVITVLLSSVGVLCSCDTEVYTDKLEYTLLEDNTYEVSGIGLATDFDIIIPSTYKGLPVTSIGEYAFFSMS